MVKKLLRNLFLFIFFLGILSSCSNPISSSLFKSKYAHQRYEEQLQQAGLANSYLFKQWKLRADQSLDEPQEIAVPYQEKGLFDGGAPQASSFLFDVKNGEQLMVELTMQAKDSVKLFLDLFEADTNNNTGPKHLVSADTFDFTISHIIKQNGRYLLRIQPELLATVSYQLTITAEASLASPIANSPTVNIGSYFGDGRDAGSRKHEGVDIFGKRLTPVVAAAAGTVSNVGTNNLGGKVVWLKPEGRNINLYYAHLDSQLVRAGKQVSIGDTLGLMGNTGNAHTTPPHLHFGIYTARGAVNPLFFLKPGKSNPPNISAQVNRLGQTWRIARGKHQLAPVYIEAAMGNQYRITLPDGDKSTVKQQDLVSLSRIIRSYKMEMAKTIYHQPDSSSARIGEYALGVKVDILGDFDAFYLVAGEKRGWIKK